MNLRWKCPECEASSRTPSVDGRDRVRCDACGAERPARPDALADPEAPRCPLCGTGEFFVQKNFPQRAGVAIVVLGVVISSIFYYFMMPFWAVGVLVLTAAIDGVLFHVVPDVLTCYRCESQLGDVPADLTRRFRPFDLAIGERYRQERLRVEQLRRQRADATSPAE